MSALALATVQTSRPMLDVLTLGAEIDSAEAIHMELPLDDPQYGAFTRRLAALDTLIFETRAETPGALLWKVRKYVEVSSEDDKSRWQESMLASILADLEAMTNRA